MTDGSRGNSRDSQTTTRSEGSFHDSHPRQASDSTSSLTSSMLEKHEWDGIKEDAGLHPDYNELHEFQNKDEGRTHLKPVKDHLYSLIEPPNRDKGKYELFGLAKSFPEVTRTGYRSRIYDYLKHKANKTDDDYKRLQEEKDKMHDSEAHGGGHHYSPFRYKDFGPFYRLRAKFHAEFAEFLAMFVFLCIGFGSSCQSYLGSPTSSNITSVTLAWGFGNMAGIYVAGGYSGAHLNPVVTLNLWFFRGFPFRRMFSFWVAQLLGAVSAAAWIFILYYPALRAKEPNGWTIQTAEVFYAGIQNDIPVATGWFNEVTGSALMHCIIFAVGDSHNIAPARGMNALVLGFTVTAIGSSFGYLSAFGLNPARDLGPRLFLSMVGIPNLMWTGKDWWWITGEITGPLLGGFLGAFAYDFFIFDGPESPINFPSDIKVRAIKFFLDDIVHPFSKHRTGLSRFRGKKTGENQLHGTVNLEGQPAGQQHGARPNS